LTAAYSKLPHGARARVTNLANGRSVVVLVTKKGSSQNRGRIINVSYRAAEELGFTRAGTARVRIAAE
jgi:rare lipoprotein A